METTIEEHFYNYPVRKFGVRELSRIANRDTKTVMKQLSTLTQHQIIKKNNIKGTYPSYEANRLSYLYRYKKSEYIVEKIMLSGLLECLGKKLHPKVIILFGSIQKGTYHQESDIDLFVQADYQQLNLNKFNKRIGHKIHLLFEKHIRNLSKGLLNNICNGRILRGTLELPYGNKNI